MVTSVKCNGNETNVGHCQFTVTDSGVVYNPSGFNDANTATYLVCGETGMGKLKFLNSSQTVDQVIVKSGVPADLVCVAGPSIPRQAIRWNLISESNVTETYQMSNIGKFLTISTLTFIPDVGKHNGSTISCHLQSTYGALRFVSESVRIFVGVAVTEVSIHNSRQSVSFGDTINLSCITSFSDPVPTVQWFINNNHSMSSSRETVFTDRQTNLSQIVSELNFTVNDTSSTSVGFHCEAFNIPSVNSVESSVVVILITPSSVESTTTDNSMADNSTLLSTGDMSEARDIPIYTYLTISLGSAVFFICVVIIVALVLRIKRIQAGNQRQNSSVDNDKRRRLPPPLDKTFEEETYENSGMSIENISDNQERYEVLEFRDVDGKKNRAGKSEEELYVNTAFRN